MPTNRKRRKRSSELDEIIYIYFTWGDCCVAEDFPQGKTPAQIKAIWKENKAKIMDRWRREMPQFPPPWAWKKWETKKTKIFISKGKHYANNAQTN